MDEAMHHYSLTLQVHYTHSHNSLALCFTPLTPLMQLEPNHHDALNNLANAYQAGRRYDEAGLK
jgi:hypothetical protein